MLKLILRKDGKALWRDHHATSEATDRIENCRARAEQCRTLADLAHNPNSKASYLSAAEQWEEIAIEIAQIEKMSSFTRENARLKAPTSS